MIYRQTVVRDGVIWILVALGLPVCVGVADEGSAIRLVVRADDIGSSHAANVACIRSTRDGIARSVEVMVPCPWFNEAVSMLNANPGCDVGVHLTLTSEWSHVKWGPMTPSPSLCDDQGNFFATTGDFLRTEPNLEEVERELRAQIEQAVKRIPNVTHLSSHMGTPTCTPELRALVDRLAKEYKLPIDFPELKRAGRWSGKDKTAEQKIRDLVQLLGDLGPGVWLMVEHPGQDTPEMQAIGHPGYENVAADRQGVTDAFTCDKVNETVDRRKIRLISYGDLIRQTSN